MRYQVFKTQLNDNLFAVHFAKQIIAELLQPLSFVYISLMNKVFDIMHSTLKHFLILNWTYRYQCNIYKYEYRFVFIFLKQIIINIRKTTNRLLIRFSILFPFNS